MLAMLFHLWPTVRVASERAGGAMLAMLFHLWPTVRVASERAGGAMLAMFLRLCPLLASLLVVALAESGGSRTPEPPGSCVAGIPGIPGHHGAPGRDGRDGEKGYAANSGGWGPLLPQGTRRIRGGWGPLLPQGTRRIRGGWGPLLPQGVTGSKGEPGIPGSKGAAGDKGREPAVPKSAFTAKISSSNPPAGSPIKFDVVVSNDQGHYDPLSGKFTCVHPGLYYFVMHAHVRQTPLCVALTKNGERVVHFCNDYTATIFATAMSGGSVLSLKAGDKVWLEVLDAYFGMFFQLGYRDSSFTGFLLFPE
uniref:Complement C1q subcomponent subunit C-like n=1 Tax=Petromyzon marinus TaxID=7757 RepID=A0AAJ7UD89_PETMA|nr:complement C1q subcomponent subunit C-like [Petromyzon marinus]